MTASVCHFFLYFIKAASPDNVTLSQISSHIIAHTSRAPRYDRCVSRGACRPFGRGRGLGYPVIMPEGYEQIIPLARKRVYYVHTAVIFHNLPGRVIPRSKMYASFFRPLPGSPPTYYHRNNRIFPFPSPRAGNTPRSAARISSHRQGKSSSF